MSSDLLKMLQRKNARQEEREARYPSGRSSPGLDVAMRPDIMDVMNFDNLSAWRIPPDDVAIALEEQDLSLRIQSADIHGHYYTLRQACIRADSIRIRVWVFLCWHAEHLEETG